MAITIPPNKQIRYQHIDNAKGLLIILVVLGHSGTILKEYIFWFHMPAFFIISGLFYKPYPSLDAYKKGMKDLTRYMIIPYFMYLLVINIYQVSHLFYINNFHEAKRFIYNLLYGGRRLTRENAIFWFISVLFITRLLIGFLNLYLSRKQIIYIVLLMFSLGTLESIFFNRYHTFDFPLNIDVVLMSCFFYYLGFLISPYLSRIKLLHIVCSTLLLLIMVIVTQLGFIQFNIDMKYSVYYNPIFVVLIPISSFILIFAFSDIITNVKILTAALTYVGRNSIFIMYLHLPLNMLFANVLSINHNVAVFMGVGITLPLIIGELLKLNNYTKSLFIGR